MSLHTWAAVLITAVLMWFLAALLMYYSKHWQKMVQPPQYLRKCKPNGNYVLGAV